MKNKITKIVKENGFLLFLFICVCLVAFSTIYIVTKEVDKAKDNRDLLISEEGKGGRSSSGENDDVLVIDEIYPKEDENKNTSEVDREDGKIEKVKEEPETEEVETENIETDVEKEQIDEPTLDQPVFAEANQNSIWPLSGEIITVFTTDNLIYSETLGEWRGHSGIDIKADLGTKVKAVKGGKVKKIEEDDLWGITIIIDHGNGLETKYANLATKEMVKEGIEVKQGDEISTVGKTAGVEMLMDSHLHFEVIRDGKLVDPRSILE